MFPCTKSNQTESWHACPFDGGSLHARPCSKRRFLFATARQRPLTRTFRSKPTPILPTEVHRRDPPMRLRLRLPRTNISAQSRITPKILVFVRGRVQGTNENSQRFVKLDGHKDVKIHRIIVVQHLHFFSAKVPNNLWSQRTYVSFLPHARGRTPYSSRSNNRKIKFRLPPSQSCKVSFDTNKLISSLYTIKLLTKEYPVRQGVVGRSTPLILIFTFRATYLSTAK